MLSFRLPSHRSTLFELRCSRSKSCRMRALPEHILFVRSPRFRFALQADFPNPSFRRSCEQECFWHTDSLFERISVRLLLSAIRLLLRQARCFHTHPWLCGMLLLFDGRFPVFWQRPAVPFELPCLRYRLSFLHLHKPFVRCPWHFACRSAFFQHLLCSALLLRVFEKRPLRCRRFVVPCRLCFELHLLFAEHSQHRSSYYQRSCLLHLLFVEHSQRRSSCFRRFDLRWQRLDLPCRYFPSWLRSYPVQPGSDCPVFEKRRFSCFRRFDLHWQRPDLPCRFLFEHCLLFVEPVVRCFWHHRVPTWLFLPFVPLFESGLEPVVHWLRSYVSPFRLLLPFEPSLRPQVRLRRPLKSFFSFMIPLKRVEYCIKVKIYIYIYLSLK